MDEDDDVLLLLLLVLLFGGGTERGGGGTGTGDGGLGGAGLGFKWTILLSSESSGPCILSCNCDNGRKLLWSSCLALDSSGKRSCNTGLCVSDLSVDKQCCCGDLDNVTSVSRLTSVSHAGKEGNTAGMCSVSCGAASR